MKSCKSLVWMIVICCLTLVSAVYVQAGTMLEKGKAVLDLCESQQVEPPVGLKALVAHLESTSPSDCNIGKRSVITILSTFSQEIIEQTWTGSQWENTDKYTDVSNSDLSEILSELHQIWDGSGWVNSDRFVINTDAQGRVVSMQFDEWGNGAWVPSMLISYTYDANGNVSELLTRMDSDYDGVLEDFSKTVSTYQNNQVVKDEMYFYYGDAWQKFSETNYTYNAQGQVTEEITGMDLGFGFNPNVKTTYTYTASGNVETETNSTYEIITQTYTNTDKTTYTYNAQGDETSEIYQLWNGSQWENNTRYTAAYAGVQDQMSQEYEESWDGSTWVGDWRNTYTYDAQGNETASLGEINDGSGWVNDEKETTSYLNNLPSERILQTWDGSVWVNDTKWLYTSSGTGVADLGESLPKSFALSNYPNPFNPSTTIQYVLPASDKITVTVFNALGVEVKTLVQNENVQAGMHEVCWDGTDAFSQPVSSGLYFYRIQGERVNQTRRCLLLK